MASEHPSTSKRRKRGGPRRRSESPRSGSAWLTLEVLMAEAADRRRWTAFAAGRRLNAAGPRERPKAGPPFVLEGAPRRRKIRMTSARARAIRPAAPSRLDGRTIASDEAREL